MALSAFFKDHKIALEIIGMFFSLGAFLTFFYNEESKNKSFVDYVAMIMPNSSFTIAIMYKNTTAAFYSLIGFKVYIVVYGLVEYP